MYEKLFFAKLEDIYDCNAYLHVKSKQISKFRFQELNQLIIYILKVKLNLVLTIFLLIYQTFLNMSIIYKLKLMNITIMKFKVVSLCTTLKKFSIFLILFVYESLLFIKTYR